MPVWVDRVVDNTLQRLGYVKRVQYLGAETVFGGEAPPRPELDFDSYTDEQKERLALTLSWVFSDINLIAGKCAGVALGIYEQDGEKLTAVVDHPFERIMQRPFRFWPRSLLMRYTFMWWLLRGEAYWWKILDGAGELMQVLPIPAGRMWPIPDDKEYIAGFYYKPKHGKPKIRIPNEQVVFFRFPNPFDFHRGLSPRTGYQWPLETDIAAARWNRDTFVKEATLRTLIGLPAELDPKVYKQAKDEILRELVEEKRRYMVARSGQVDVKTLGLSHKELEFLGGREFSREEIDRVFGIPAGYWAKEATRANSEAAEAKLISNTVWPLLGLAHDAITEQVVIPHYGDQYRARYEDIRPRDRKLLVMERREYWKVYKVDEARADLGMEPLEDDELGGTLVPLVAAMGRAPVMPPAPAEVKAAGEGIRNWGLGIKALREELRKWRSVARRMEQGGRTRGDMSSRAR